VAELAGPGGYGLKNIGYSAFFALLSLVQSPWLLS